MNLNPTEVIAAGFAASAVIFILRLIYEIAAKKKFTVPDWVMVVMVYIAAFILAMIFTPAQLPVFPSGGDPSALVPAYLTWLEVLLTYLSAVAVVATVFYVFILQKVKDGLNPALAPSAYKDAPKA